MSYSLENRSLAQLKADLSWYQHKRLRISGDYLKLKRAIENAVRNADPKSELSLALKQFFAYLDESHTNIEKRFDQQTNALHIEIANRIQQQYHDPATVDR